MDLEAITELGKGVSDFELIHLPSTHAKVYVADWNRAIVTSGNLTQPGLCGNIEYGVSFSNETLVREVRTDVEGYGRLGALVALQDVESLTLEMEELRKLFQRAENSIRSQARNAFREKLEATRNQVLRQRAKGKTTHAIFSETVLFLLGKKAMRTEELHPAIKLLHPDLCDDSIDRVIDRVHFGKKWKHYVRNAQQSLKRLGRIRFKDGYWHLLSP